MEKIVNSHLEIYIDKKKCAYLYLMYDPKNKGYFPKTEFIESLLVVPKPKKIKKQPIYLTKLEEILERIREQMKILFYSANDLKNEYEEF